MSLQVEKRTLFASLPLQRIPAKTARFQCTAAASLNTTWNELVHVLACSWGAAARSIASNLVLMFKLLGCAVFCAVMALFSVPKLGRLMPAGWQGQLWLPLLQHRHTPGQAGEVAPAPLRWSPWALCGKSNSTSEIEQHTVEGADGHYLEPARAQSPKRACFRCFAAVSE